jgi:hypothetical protein
MIALSATVIPVDIRSARNPRPADVNAFRIRKAAPFRTFSFTIYGFEQSGPTRSFRATRRVDQTSGLEAPASIGQRPCCSWNVAKTRDGTP